MYQRQRQLGTQAVLMEVSHERDLQEERFGQQDHMAADWLVILMEEVGEVAKEACEARFMREFLTRSDLSPAVRSNAVFLAKVRAANYRQELVQVAAVAVAMIEAYDRFNQKQGDGDNG